MTYYESAKGIQITRERAQKEVNDHGCCFDEMLEEIGDRDFYAAQEVLAWLGH